MASTSGIRASGSGTSEYMKKIILKDALSYGPWRPKLTAILDAEDCLEIVNGTELEPVEIAEVLNADNTSANNEEVNKRQVEIKDWRKRSKKAASLITQTMDDSIVMSLDVHGNNPTLMWAQLGADYNTITPAQRSSARTDFLTFKIGEDESYIDTKLRYDELLRKLTVQGGMIGENDRLQTLLGALPRKYDHLKESYFAQTPAPGIRYVWDRMYNIESQEKKRELQEESSGMGAGVYYQSARGRGNFRGRGRRGTFGGRGVGRGNEGKSENCFRCGESDHWSRECPQKDTICTWCAGVGHIEQTCYSKVNGAPRGGKSGVLRSRGRGAGAAGRGGYSRYGQGADEEGEQGHAEVLIGEISMGSGEDDGEDRDWVCDSGADYHMSGDITLFESLSDIPTKFYVKQIKGEVSITKWGVVRLYTDKGKGVRGALELHEVLYLPGMRVNIFSLQRIRDKGECSFAFEGKPHPEKLIPILNKEGQQIATMRETLKGRPTLVCLELNVPGEMKGEVLGGKGISMELLHKRLGHTSQGGMERLVREQMVRGLEEGMKGDFGMCRGCKMGKSSEKTHPRKSQEYRATEPLELVHTDIAGPFKPKAVGGGGGQYNLVVIDDFSRKSWTIPLRKKSDTKVALKQWIAVNENQSGKKVKKLRSDNGGEYVDGELETWLKEHGILHQTIPARSP